MQKYAAEIKKFGKKVRKIRLDHKMSQATLAGYCDVDIRTIQRLEKGEYGIGLHILYALADALKITVKNLFE